MGSVMGASTRRSEQIEKTIPCSAPSPCFTSMCGGWQREGWSPMEAQMDVEPLRVLVQGQARDCSCGLAGRVLRMLKARPPVTQIHVVDTQGRDYVHTDCQKVELVYQDDGRTLTVTIIGRIEEGS
jgi:hypothetical protein